MVLKMYSLLDNLKDLPMKWDAEIHLPPEIFAASFNEAYVADDDRHLEECNVSTYVYLKGFACPVCRANFESGVLRQSKLRVLRVEGLRPIYKDIEPLCYDVLLCINCGYAALKDRFDSLTDKQRDSIINNIRLNYSNFMPASNPEKIDLKQGIERFKYALLTAVVRKATSGEIAMLLIKISWLYKTLGDTENYLLFAKHAYETLEVAYSSERFPIMGLSQAAATYLLATYATYFGEYEKALKLLANIITDRSLAVRIRDLARDLKDEIARLRKTTDEDATDE
jgi:hypothetical protein